MRPQAPTARANASSAEQPSERRTERSLESPRAARRHRTSPRRRPCSAFIALRCTTCRLTANSGASSCCAACSALHFALRCRTAARQNPRHAARRRSAAADSSVASSASSARARAAASRSASRAHRPRAGCVEERRVDAEQDPSVAYKSVKSQSKREFSIKALSQLHVGEKRCRPPAGSRKPDILPVGDRPRQASSAHIA